MSVCLVDRAQWNALCQREHAWKENSISAYIAFVTLLARRLILLMWKSPISPSHTLRLKEVLNSAKLEKIRCIVRGSLGKFHKMWNPFYSDGVGGVCRLRPHRASPAGNRLQFGAHLQLAAHIPQDVHELTPELHSHEGVQDGIEAAVEVAKRGGDHHGFLQRYSDSTAVARTKCVHHESDVVRRPADEEHHHHGHDDPESFLLLKALGAAAQPVQDAGITEDEDGGGQQEARRVGEQAGGQFPIKDSFGVEAEVVGNTLCSVASPVILNSIVKDPVREREQQREDPHRQAADVNHPGVPAGVHLGRVDDGQRQCQQQQDVGHPQVEDEGVRHTPPPPAPSQNPQQHPVPQDSHSEGHGVQNWYEHRLKVHALSQVTHITAITTILIRGIVHFIQVFHAVKQAVFGLCVRVAHLESLCKKKKEGI
ncbi:hypothetical protein F7725_018036 [Dissostichus mawsoni]|uniref:Uncharacterized protein n=1 Tax=Dissostichus mawsoni TaxID=36200 RepID=A0A7J5XRZ8_DISMA|nr:hypothetical protein F7725_018036 [Dissostichus mawsoni]